MPPRPYRVDDMQKTALTIPCYNEEKRLFPEGYKQFLAQNPAVDLIFVDDGSADATYSTMEAIAAANPGRVFALRQPVNAGKAEAVRRGVCEAFEKGYHNAGFWDADNSAPLRLVRYLIADLEHKNVEMVMGSRVNMLGKRICRSHLRHYMGRLFATIASSILRLQVYDTQCGAKVFRNSRVMRQVFSTPFSTGWTFDLEVIARAVLANRETEPGTPADRLIIEHPLDEWVDVAGSKLKPSHMFRIGLDLLRIYAIYHKKIRP